MAMPPTDFILHLCRPTTASSQWLGRQLSFSESEGFLLEKKSVLLKFTNVFDLSSEETEGVPACYFFHFNLASEL